MHFINSLCDSRLASVALMATCLASSVSALEPDKLFDKVSRSVVQVVNNGEKGVLATGSGVVIEPHRVITNCHVLREGKSVDVKLGAQRYPAHLLLPDPERDLCLLAVKDLSAPAVEKGPLAQVRVGQKVYAVGAPQGLELTLTDGLVSSLRGKVGAQFIQTSAPVSRGSSGGGLFDDAGRLIGITVSSIQQGQNLNFAIPADYLLELPERARTALEKRRQKEAAAASAQSQSQSQSTSAASRSVPAAAVNERQLNADEVRGHVAALSVVDATLSGGAGIRLEFTWGNGFSMSTLQGLAERVSGVHTLNGNRLCLRPTPVGAALTRMSGLQVFATKDCYAVYQTGAKSYVWKAQSTVSSNAVMLSYTLP